MQLLEYKSGLDDISPQWASKIRRGEIDKASLQNPKCCVVGEAYGNSDYMTLDQLDPHYCDDCMKYSLDIYFNAFRNHELRSDLTGFHKQVNGFVEHWNSCHGHRP